MSDEPEKQAPVPADEQDQPEPETPPQEEGQQADEATPSTRRDEN